MEESKITPLSQLPETDKSDADLVNKILTELEKLPDEDKTSVESSELKKDVVKKSDKEVIEEVEEAEENLEIMEEKMNDEDESRFNRLNSIYKSIDIDRLSSILKMSGVLTILFFVFVHFQYKFINIFSKIPYLSRYVNGSVSLTSEIIQSLIFGMIYFFMIILIG